MERVQVPLWLAITLKRENKCRIVMPDWMRLSRSLLSYFRIAGYLKRVLEKDKEMELSNESRLSDLPEHYIEISRLLLENCEDDIEDAKEVRSTIDAIIKVRENCLNEFRGRVIDYVSSAVQQNRNQETYDEFVRRPFYNVPFSVSNSTADHRRRIFLRGASPLLALPPGAGGAQQARESSSSGAFAPFPCLFPTNTP